MHFLYCDGENILQLFAHALKSPPATERGAGGGFLLLYTLQPHQLLLRCDRASRPITSPGSGGTERLSLRSVFGRGLCGVFNLKNPIEAPPHPKFSGAPTSCSSSSSYRLLGRGSIRGQLTTGPKIGECKNAPQIFGILSPGAKRPGERNLRTRRHNQRYTIAITFFTQHFRLTLHNNEPTQQCISQQCYSARNVTFIIYYIYYAQDWPWLACWPTTIGAHIHVFP
jgi:hypothetical protein